MGIFQYFINIIVPDILGWQGTFFIQERIRRFDAVSKDDIYEILKAAHNGPCGGHFADKRTCHKVLQMGYYWPSIFCDAQNYVRRCDSCQRMGQPGRADEMPL